MANRSVQNTIPSLVNEVLHAHVGADVEFTTETDLLNELAIDSLELVELGVKIGKQLEKKLPAAELRQCTTVGELVQLVQKVAEHTYN